jgi:hypothetical protein
MIAFIVEMVIGKIVGLFMSQRWYMAIAYTLALLSLVAVTITGVGYLIVLWLFRPEDFGKPLTIAFTVGFLAFVVAIWIGFSVIQRRVFK